MFEQTGSALDIVRVTDAKRSMVYFNGFTQAAARPAGAPANHAITFGEASLGTAPPIVAWYPEGKSTGHRFLYPDKR